MKQKIWAVILAGGILFAGTACAQQEAEVPQTLLVQEDETKPYPVTTVEYGEVVKNADIKCTYVSTEKQELSFPVDNKLIERVEVKLGDYVNKGQLLAALDVADLEDEIEELEYQVNSLELKLKQTEEMKEFDLAGAETLFTYTHMEESDKKGLKEQKEGIIKQYQTTLEDISDQLSIQKQRLQQSKKELAEGRLYADIAGEITYIDNTMLDTYSKKDKVVVTISNMDACYFTAGDIDMEYADCFQEGVSVFVNYREGGVDIACEVVPALMDRWDEQMYFKPVEEEIIANKTGGTITMEIARKDNILCIPKGAIHESDQGQFVYLEKDGLLEMRYVTVGLEGDTMVEITDGLAQGETVALKK